MGQRFLLSRFSHSEWRELEPGRVGLLRLEGDNGCLDIFCVYLDPQSHLNRQNSLNIIKNAMRPKSDSLSILTGDFNFVEFADDRWNLSGEEFTGFNNSNKPNADLFKDVFRDGLDFHEWEQSSFTCDAGGARSKIDRMYINQHVSYQLDHHCSCSALEWDIDLSRHRAISFSRRSPAPRCSQDKPLQPDLFKREGWREDVVKRFTELSNQDTIAPSACRGLILIKDAFRECSTKGGQYENGDPEGDPPPPDDKLGYITSCIKAIERGNAKRVAQIRNHCSFLAERIPAHRSRGEVSDICQKLRDEAVSTSRQIVAEEIQQLSLNPPMSPKRGRR